ncbi:MAG TPA: MarC family protein [Polyangiaceae bacterium]|nr:MarC family protein [Polyangiaceae bacterium]
MNLDGSVLTFGLVTLGSLIAIVDPIAAIPVYLGLTAHDEPARRRLEGDRAALTCWLVLSAFAAAGTSLFRFFGITIPAFKIAGGILLFGVAVEMLQAKVSRTKTSRREEEEAEHRPEVGILPLGIPLLSGPGAIAAVVVHAGRAQKPAEFIALFAAIALTALGAMLSFRFAGRLERVLGATGISVIARLMGLLLAAVSVQFVLDGVREAFPHMAAGPAGTEAKP